jgi:hypothetical protein
MDKIENVSFFMNSDKDFIYVDTNNNIINKYSRYSKKNEQKLLKELDQCEITEKIDRNVLHYYEHPNAGIAHCTAKISTYLRLITKYRGSLIIPNHTNQNVINLTSGIFSNILILQPNIKYTFSKFIFSVYIELMDEPKIMKPDNKYPLIVYNNDIYWFRTFINKHIDFTMEKKPIYDKIFVGKFEGQGDTGGNITKPRSILGCVSKNMLEQFEKNGFKNIDPYEHHIHNVIYYLRNAKEIILSVGTCGHLYVPFIKQISKLYFITNVLYDQGITFGDLNIDYNIKSDIVQRFFPSDTKICFYNYAPHYDARVNKDNIYKGIDMLEFLNQD